MRKIKFIMTIMISFLLLNIPNSSINRSVYADENDNSLQISKFYLNATDFNPKTNPLKINFTSNQACVVYCYIADASGELVAKVSDGGKVPSAGAWVLTWKGLDTQGNYVKAGNYTIGIGLGNESGDTEALYKDIKVNYGTNNTVSNQNKVVNFPDKALEEWIRTYADKPSGDILVSDVQKITKLDAEATHEGFDGIKDLTGMEYLTNLTYLNLGKTYGSNHITNINKLSGLKNLRELYLNFNQISNIDALKGLTNLRVLQIGGNKITNIEPLRNLTNLQSLYLGVEFLNGGNNITDLTPISGLTNLTELGLYGNNNIKNIESLRGMTKLTYLNLRGPNISNIDALKGMVNLKYLNVGTGNGRIGNISVLSGLKELRELDLASNRISNINVLSGLSKLETLSIAGNAVSKLAPLKNLQNLKSLSVGTQCAGGNPIRDITILSEFKNLKTLELDDLSISKIDFLRNLTNLNVLSLKYNKITNINSISGLQNLKELMLSGNKISDITPLSGLQKLEYLWLNSNKITDIEALRGLTKLQSLHLSENNIQDFSPINGFYDNIYDADFK